MFVLLEHDARAPAERGRAAGPDEVHWDLLIELPGQERLATWRLLDNPIGGPAEIGAERIGDHRRTYLEYEGEISGGRGGVRRLDRGMSTLVGRAGDVFVIELAGAHLRGRFEIGSSEGKVKWFRPATGR